MRHFVFALCTLLWLNAGCAKVGRSSYARSGVLRIAMTQEPISLDPLLLEGPVAYAVSELFYSYLTNYDEHGRLVADLARVPTLRNGGVSPDGRRIIFHLRRGVRWQDGAPLTARDVVFSYDAVMNSRNEIPDRYGYDRVASVTAPDAYTVVVRLKHRFSPIVPLFFGGDSNYPILPAHVLARYASIDKAPFNEAPVGSGPFMLAAWKRGDRLELRANPRYYRGRPSIERLVLPFIHNPATVVNELQDGEIDAAFSLDASQIAILRTLPQKRIAVTPIPYFYAISFNMQDPVLRDRRVRQALSMAIDRDRLIAKVSHRVYAARTGMRGLFTWAFDARADSLAYDPRAAARLLDAAGWKIGDGGTRWKDGRPLQLQLAFPGGSDVTAQLATVAAQEESAIGASVTLKRYSRQIYMLGNGPIMQGRYQMQIYDYHSDYDPDASWLLACDQQSPHGFNVARYCSDFVDAALRKAARVFGRSERRAEYARVQQRIARDVPYLFLAQGSEIDVVPSRLRGYGRPLLAPFASVADWSLR